MFHAVRMLPDPIFEMYGGGTVKVTGKRRNAEGLRYIYCPHPGLDQLELKLVWAFESQVKVLGAPKTVAVIFPTFLYHEPIYMLCYLHSDSVEVMIEKAYNSEYESLQQDLANRPQMLRQKDAYEERMKLVDKVFGKFTEKVTPPAPSQSQAHSLSAAYPPEAFPKQLSDVNDWELSADARRQIDEYINKGYKRNWLVLTGPDKVSFDPWLCEIDARE